MVSFSILVGFSLLALTSSVSVPMEVMRRGACPKPGLMQNFDVARYMGKWYSYQRFPFNQNDGTSSCTSANYTLLADSKVKVFNVGYYITPLWILHRERIETVGEAVAFNPAQPAALHVSFFGRTSSPDEEPNYTVVETDYDNYAVIYSCLMDSRTDVNTQYAWILTRKRGEVPANRARLYSLLTSAGVDVHAFFTVDQSDCP